MKKRGPIGKYLDQLLLDRAWHQTDLAENSGMSVAFISEIMRGGKNLPSGACGKIAAALETSQSKQAPIYYRLHYLAALGAGFDIAERYAKDPVPESKE